jgi:hypothetical protein
MDAVDAVLGAVFGIESWLARHPGGRGLHRAVASRAKEPPVSANPGAGGIKVSEPENVD